MQVPALAFAGRVRVVAFSHFPAGFKGVACYRFLNRFTCGNFGDPDPFGLERGLVKRGLKSTLRLQGRPKQSTRRGQFADLIRMFPVPQNVPGAPQGAVMDAAAWAGREFEKAATA